MGAGVKAATDIASGTIEQISSAPSSVTTQVAGEQTKKPDQVAREKEERKQKDATRLREVQEEMKQYAERKKQQEQIRQEEEQKVAQQKRGRSNKKRQKKRIGYNDYYTDRQRGRGGEDEG